MWDERFHALVAKNALQQPFVPRLYPEKVLEGSYDTWAASYIWLHKQPLFTWQMAVSMKLFGVNEVAVRIPSALMSSLMVLMVVRMGKLLFNQRAGFFAALLCAVSPFAMLLVSGRQGMDHNDLAFAFYITAACWCYTEYDRTRKLHWAIAAGIFSGGAVLVKWLVGLFVFLAWGIVLLSGFRQTQRKDWLHFAAAVGVCLVVFLPWQLYILHQFPAEAMKAYRFNTAHITQALEGHQGNFWFHFRHLSDLYGYALLPFIVVGLVRLIYAKQIARPTIGFLCAVVFVYALFSIAKTKVIAHPFCVSFFFFLVAGYGMEWFYTKCCSWIRNHFVSTGIAVLIATGITLAGIQPWKLHKRHFQEDEIGMNATLRNHRLLYDRLNKTLPPQTVVFNVRGIHYVELMFYTGFTGYPFKPSKRMMEEVRNKNLPMAMFVNPWETVADSFSTGILLLHEDMGGFVQ
jgi:4-amino-4-deoxy-L-arabinose transferase